MYRIIETSVKIGTGESKGSTRNVFASPRRLFSLPRRYKNLDKPIQKCRHEYLTAEIVDDNNKTVAVFVKGVEMASMTNLE